MTEETDIDHDGDSDSDKESDEAESEQLDYNLSASRVKSFVKCGEQYRLKYVEDEEPTKKQKGYGILGALVHEAIENILTENPLERDENVLKRKFRQEFLELEQTDEYDMSLISDKQRSDGLDTLPVAAKFISKQDFNLRGVEVRCHYDIENPIVDATTLGYMDVCTENEIWDWKTGRIRDETERDEMIQGSVYMAGYQQVYGEMPEAIRFVYIKEEKVRTMVPSEEDWLETLHHAKDLRKAQDGEEEFEASPGDKCYFCAYEGWCDASPVGAGQIVNEIQRQPELWDRV